MPIHVGAILRMRNMQRPLEKQGDHIRAACTNNQYHKLGTTLLVSDNN